MAPLDRLQWTALVTLALTLLLVGVGALKRVLMIASGPLEDVNRALGALVGLAALAALVLAVRHARRGVALVGSVLVALGGIAGAGVLGVRGPALFAPRPLALLQVAATAVVLAALAAACALARPPGERPRAGLAFGALGALALVLAQGALGVNARATLDGLARAVPPLPREQRFENVGVVELLHVQAGPLVMLTLAALWFVTRARGPDASWASRAVTLALAASVAQVLVGLALVWAALPPLAQVAHLLGALVTVGALTAAALSAARGA